MRENHCQHDEMSREGRMEPETKRWKNADNNQGDTASYIETRIVYLTHALAIFR
jgi:hypothetical protein